MRIKSTLAVMAVVASSALGAKKVSIDSNNNLVINDKTIFPISVAILPPADGKAPNGKSAWEELNDGGVNLARVIPHDDEGNTEWDQSGFKNATAYMDSLASAHMYAWLWLGEGLSYLKPDDVAAQNKLKEIIQTYKDHPALACWKGADEPLWGNMNTHGKKPPSSIALTYKTIHDLDPNHPVIIIQAPRGTAAELTKYDPYLDITGMDVFPISYPPGGHVATWPNKEISCVGDWTKIIVDGAAGKPVWMTLQIAFSGTSMPGKTLRFPTFFQERFMTYEAIIDGARGINYFGGSNRGTLNDRDKNLGYNWTFWDRILKPLLSELNDKSPLHDALIAPDSKLPIKVEGGNGIEFTTREVGNDIYVLACKREGATVEAKFTGLPTGISTGDVLYEEPRKVTVKNGAFSDWFGPFDVHVYHFSRAGK